jgi:hypothetical protein
MKLLIADGEVKYRCLYSRGVTTSCEHQMRRHEQEDNYRT